MYVVFVTFHQVNLVGHPRTNHDQGDSVGQEWLEDRKPPLRGGKVKLVILEAKDGGVVEVREGRVGLQLLVTVADGKDVVEVGGK